MRRIATVLLIPSPEGRLQDVLEEGMCGARPPTAWQSADGDWWESGLIPTAQKPVGPWTRALALAWMNTAILVGIIYTDDPELAPWVESILAGSMDDTDWEVFHDTFGDLGTWLFLDGYGKGAP